MTLNDTVEDLYDRIEDLEHTLKKHKSRSMFNTILLFGLMFLMMGINWASTSMEIDRQFDKLDQRIDAVEVTSESAMIAVRKLEQDVQDLKAIAK